MKIWEESLVNQLLSALIADSFFFVCHLLTHVLILFIQLCTLVYLCLTRALNQILCPLAPFLILFYTLFALCVCHRLYTNIYNVAVFILHPLCFVQLMSVLKLLKISIY